MTDKDKNVSEEAAEMSGQTISAISIIPLSLGSVLLLAAGSGLISSKYPVAAGLICFLVYVFFEGISKKKPALKSTSDGNYPRAQKTNRTNHQRHGMPNRL